MDRSDKLSIVAGLLAILIARHGRLSVADNSDLSYVISILVRHFYSESQTMRTLCVALLLLGASVGFAQETKDSAVKELKLAGFAWLKQFEGRWATSFNGTMVSRTLGQKWIISEIRFQKGKPYSVQTIGYDSKEKKFVGTWVDESSSHIWIYTGTLDPSGKKLTLAAEGPDMSDPQKMRKYRDIYEFTSKDEIESASEMLNENGEWRSFSKGKMTRIHDGD